MFTNAIPKVLLLAAMPAMLLAGLVNRASADDGYINLLVSQLRYSENDDTRERAAKQLGELRVADALGDLYGAAVYDPEDDVRDAARKAVLKITDKVAPTGGIEFPENQVGMLMQQVLWARDDDDRERAAKALGQIGDERALPALETAAIFDKEDDVRDEAREAALNIQEMLAAAEEAARQREAMTGYYYPAPLPAPVIVPQPTIIVREVVLQRPIVIVRPAPIIWRPAVIHRHGKAPIVRTRHESRPTFPTHRTDQTPDRNRTFPTPRIDQTPDRNRTFPTPRIDQTPDRNRTLPTPRIDQTPDRGARLPNLDWKVTPKAQPTPPAPQIQSTPRVQPTPPAPVILPKQTTPAKQPMPAIQPKVQSLPTLPAPTIGRKLDARPMPTMPSVGIKPTGPTGPVVTPQVRQPNRDRNDDDKRSKTDRGGRR